VIDNKKYKAHTGIKFMVAVTFINSKNASKKEYYLGLVDPNRAVYNACRKTITP